MRKRIVILGSTGSVGRNVLDVVDRHRERFEVVGLSTGRSVDVVAQQSAAHAQAWVCVSERAANDRLTQRFPELLPRVVEAGDRALANLIDRCAPDLVVNCLVGFVGLEPTLEALRAGVPVALANKEAIVTGGALVRRACEASGAHVVPIDSEHVAISQCLQGARVEDVKAVYLTASGGALRDYPIGDLAKVRPEQVLAHPTWDMGKKITVDSATLMNKGLEVIEAHWLFDVPFDRISVVIHPQSIIHSMVEFRDNSILAQLGVPDMRLPVLYALTYPERVDTDIARSRITDFPSLSFEKVDPDRYPCLDLAVRAGRSGGNSPTILNSANEVAVGAFLASQISFSRIYEIIDSALSALPRDEITGFEDVLETDRRTRAYIREKMKV